ncbi:MAG TPA: pitrilysin family protein [Methylomirabilota bacterium]|nr:pitrilysin family protein [Methylomirabilota bacterium]
MTGSAPRAGDCPGSPTFSRPTDVAARGGWHRCTALGMAAWLFAAGAVAPLTAQQVAVREQTLSNGMRLLMVERHDDPTIAGGWVAHVGSANERPGITGMAHLFEHMMFKGTPTLGTKDYQKDLEIIAAQEKVREEMRREEAKLRAAWRRGEIDDLLKPENKTPRLRELEKQFNELIARQREILVKNEFDRIYTTAGGSGMNAFTTADLTAYFITVPANKLELWMWMESERILRPVFREFYAERDVVFEERRMRTEATPLGRFEESFEAMIWESHPYGWPTVGWPSDIPAITKAQADEFYALYYAPQNISLILVGDFQAATAAAMAENYFGRIPRGRDEAPEVVTLEMQQTAEKRLYGEAEANPQVDLVWKTVAFQHRDSYPLNILAQILSTRTGRLYKGLVQGAQLATEASAAVAHRKYAGLFNINAEVREGRTPEEVEQAIYAELDKLKQEEVPAEELQKVKNQFAASEYRRLTSNMSILMQLMFNDGYGDWREINEAGRKHQAVTAADVKRVANTYLTRENRNVAIYTRKAANTTAAEPELAGLAPEQQSIVRLLKARLKEEKNPETLRQKLATLEEQAGKADARSRPFLDLQKRLLQQRLAELQ